MTGVLGSAFYFACFLDQFSIARRPTSPLPVAGLTFVYRSKQGPRYVTHFEQIMLTYGVRAPLVLLAIMAVLIGIYGQYQLRYDTERNRVRNVRVFPGDINWRRILAWSLVGLAAWTTLWLLLP